MIMYFITQFKENMEYMTTRLFHSFNFNTRLVIQTVDKCVYLSDRKSTDFLKTCDTHINLKRKIFNNDHIYRIPG